MNPPNRSESVCLENRFDCLVVLIHWKQLGNIFPSNSYLSHKPTFPFVLLTQVNLTQNVHSDVDLWALKDGELGFFMQHTEKLNAFLTCQKQSTNFFVRQKVFYVEAQRAFFFFQQNLLSNKPCSQFFSFCLQPVHNVGLIFFSLCHTTQQFILMYKAFHFHTYVYFRL